MTKLSDTQAIILVSASQRSDGNVLPLPGSLRGGAVTKVVDALLKRGMIEEKVTDSHRTPDAALNTVWRNDADGRAALLFITPAGLEAIGVEPDSVAEGATEAGLVEPGNDPAEAAEAPQPPGSAPQAVETAPKPRTGTKQARLIGMLRAPEGASIAEIVAATGWQPHTVRGAISGGLRKKLGLEVTSEKIDGRGRVYRIPG